MHALFKNVMLFCLLQKYFIKLLCKVEGVEYKETKEVKKRQIRITDVALVVKEVLDVDIKVNI